jgi:hypothetical protein
LAGTEACQSGKEARPLAGTEACPTGYWLLTTGFFNFKIRNPQSAILAYALCSMPSEIPNPQSEIPNPQSEIPLKIGLVFAALVTFKNWLQLKK